MDLIAYFTICTVYAQVRHCKSIFNIPEILIFLSGTTLLIFIKLFQLDVYRHVVGG